MFFYMLFDLNNGGVRQAMTAHLVTDFIILSVALTQVLVVGLLLSLKVQKTVTIP